MSKSEINPNWIMHRAYIRDGKLLHLGEAVMLACLVRSQGRFSRAGDMAAVQKIMRDRNAR